MNIIIRLVFWAVFYIILTTKGVTYKDWQYWVLAVLVSLFANIIQLFTGEVKRNDMDNNYNVGGYYM